MCHHGTTPPLFATPGEEIARSFPKSGVPNPVAASLWLVSTLKTNLEDGSRARTISHGTETL